MTMELKLEKKATSDTKSTTKERLLFIGKHQADNGDVIIGLNISGHPAGVRDFCERNDIPFKLNGTMELPLKAQVQKRLTDAKKEGPKPPRLDGKTKD